MNMTPFIDVLLVLIVMLLLSIPIATHNLEVPLPGKGLVKFAVQAQNSVTIDRSDRLFWNGNKLSRDDLGAQLTAAAGLEDQPVIRFEPEALASYDRSAKTIALIKDSGIEKFAFVGNERYREFGR
ncbi:biopolymer transporter ExbD [Erythrobacter jejuensis]|uniref:Biopolymer transporter ExbD n=2 Tax=Parerythrobacter jejuensis TaxID=795812 RepID=A0A845AMZ9_9SPHN|nr:biopolymer transporter ExbD [Parerythrobacter jejuensis]MXP33567.1 biopolymer transporter ExbD [Parerythrobacter jejuensis]